MFSPKRVVKEVSSYRKLEKRDTKHLKWCRELCCGLEHWVDFYIKMYMCASATAINLPSELFNEVQYLHGVCLSRGGLPIGKDSPIVSSQHIYNERRKTDLSRGDKNQKRSHRIRAVSFCIIFASTNSSLVTQKRIPGINFLPAELSCQPQMLHKCSMK